MAPTITISKEMHTFWPFLGSLWELSESLKKSSSERKNNKNFNVFGTWRIQEASQGPRLRPGRSSGSEIIPTGAEPVPV